MYMYFVFITIVLYEFDFLYQVTDGLLAEVDVALLKAQQAIQDAEDFLVRARKQLQQLQGMFSIVVKFLQIQFCPTYPRVVDFR